MDVVYQLEEWGSAFSWQRQPGTGHERLLAGRNLPSEALESAVCLSDELKGIGRFSSTNQTPRIAGRLARFWTIGARG